MVVTLKPSRSVVFRSGRCNRQASAMVLLAVMLPVVLSVAAYVINVVYMETARTELQIATDLAARAGGRTLAIMDDRNAAITSADAILAANPCLGKTLTLADTEIWFGASTRIGEEHRYEFNVSEKANAFKIQSFSSEDIPMLFPSFGVPIGFRPSKTSIVTQLEVDICLVLDRSGSMAWHSEALDARAQPLDLDSDTPVPQGSRWLDMVACVDELCRTLGVSIHDERVALCTYSTKAKTDVQLTNQYHLIQQAMDIHSNSFEGGATGIGEGILEGIKALGKKQHARPWASRVMIVMTDGHYNYGADPLFAAYAAAQEQITIYTVTFSQNADQLGMADVAKAGSGRHFHVVNRDELIDAFGVIGRSLPTLISQ